MEQKPLEERSKHIFELEKKIIITSNGHKVLINEKTISHLTRHLEIIPYLELAIKKAVVPDDTRDNVTNIKVLVSLHQEKITLPSGLVKLPKLLHVDSIATFGYRGDSIFPSIITDMPSDLTSTICLCLDSDNYHLNEKTWRLYTAYPTSISCYTEPVSQLNDTLCNLQLFKQCIAFWCTYAHSIDVAYPRRCFKSSWHNLFKQYANIKS